MIELRAALLGVRIVRWPFKLVYIVCAYAATFLFVRLVGFTELPDGALQILILVLDLVAIWYGSRIFRGRSEPLEPARPWWQLTARPTASRRIGAVFLTLGALLGLSIALLVVTHGSGRSSTLSIYRSPISVILAIVEYFVIGIAYAHSARRLRLAMPIIDVTPVPRVIPVRQPSVQLPTQIATTRHPVVGIVPTILEDALAGRSRVQGLLITGDVSGPHSIELVIGGISVGRLKEAGRRRYEHALEGLPAPLEVDVLLTGDRLWVELPEPGDIIQLSIDTQR